MTDPGRRPQALIDLEGRVAIVTGAGSRGPGIGNGRAVAIQLARAGAKVLVVDADDDSAALTVKMIKDEGHQAESFVADVSMDDGCRSIVDKAVATWGRLDILVNNVGVAGPLGSAVTVDLEAWHKCVDVNLTSALMMVRHSIPVMTSAGGGAIVNVSSAAGITGGYPHIAYSTTKGALSNFTRSVAATHGPEGIRVNTIAPGFVHTPMVEHAGVNEEGRVRRRNAAPLRTEGTGWDIANAALFLVSDLSRWITGVVVPVDAGLLTSHPALGSTQHSTGR
jgi:NAD(P)-dependent dehydrogenase (short-subunit alcohol dehydrogenase family)